MESAFGIDHGYEEIEKGLFSSVGEAATLGTKKLATGLGRNSAVMRRGAPAGGVKQTLGGMGGKAAGGLRKLGQGMAARPGLTGGLTVGGAGLGAAGVGAGAHSMATRNQRLSQYR